MPFLPIFESKSGQELFLEAVGFAGFFKNVVPTFILKVGSRNPLGE